MPEHKKKKRKIRANQMFGGAAEFVSVVGKGANGVPFRIMKAEEAMKLKIGNIDLGKLFQEQKHKNDDLVSSDLSHYLGVRAFEKTLNPTCPGARSPDRHKWAGMPR